MLQEGPKLTKPDSGTSPGTCRAPSPSGDTHHRQDDEAGMLALTRFFDCLADLN